MDDAALVLETLAGDTRAFERLVTKYRQTLMSMARHLTGSMHDAEDLAQEALVKAYKGLSELQDPAKFRPWLFTILRNRCLTVKQRAGVATVSLDDFAETLPSPALPEASRIAWMIDQLPLSYREVLIAHYLLELSYPEIAAMQQTTEQTIRMRSFRARAMLRKLQQKEDNTQARAMVRQALLLIPITTELAFTERVLKEIHPMVHSNTQAQPLASAFPHMAIPALWKNYATIGKIAIGIIATLGILYLGGMTIPIGPSGKPPFIAFAKSAGWSQAQNVISLKGAQGESIVIPNAQFVRDATGNFYLAVHPKGRPLPITLMKYDRNGTVIGSWALPQPHGGFKGPVSDGRNLYFLDSRTDGAPGHVYQYTKNGQLITQWDVAPHTPAQSDLSIGIDGQSHLLVAGGTSAYGILVYSAEGHLLTTIPSPKWPEEPFGITVEGIAAASNGTLYGVYLKTNEIIKFSTAGQFITKWGSLGTKQSQFQLLQHAITVDHSGNVWVGDSGKHGQLKQFTPNGHLLHTILYDSPDRIGDIQVGEDGILYVLDWLSSNIHMVVPTKRS